MGRLSVKKGISAAMVTNIPEKWDPQWMRRFISTWMENGDARNAVAGTGVAISGNATTPATFSVNSNVQNLFTEPFIIFQTATELTNALVLRGDETQIHTAQGSGFVVISILPNTIGTAQIDETMTPTWTGLQTFNAKVALNAEVDLNGGAGSAGQVATSQGTGNPPIWAPISQFQSAPNTQTGNYAMASSDYYLIFNGSGSITLTLLAASTNTGRQLTLKTIANQTVVSASSNVVPISTATPGTAILAGTAGKWATLVSDGTNWITMAGN